MKFLERVIALITGKSLQKWYSLGQGEAVPVAGSPGEEGIFTTDIFVLNIAVNFVAITTGRTGSFED